MSYKRIMLGVEKLVDAEYQIASDDHGSYFARTHEGYAVLKEEIEEASAEMESVEWHGRYLWRSVKSEDKDNCKDVAEIILHKAVCLACESIQTAAMAKKLILSIKEEEKA